MTTAKISPARYDYYSVAGDEIHEVAVGPVHAGVIEPGHFRFNCIGERVLNLEIQLGYQHRGVEDLLLSADARRLPFIAENIAGDTSVGHSLCHAQAMEALCRHTGGCRGQDHPHHRPGTGAHRQPCGRPGRLERRCGLSAAGQLLRPHARRFSQHVPAPLRQPLRQRPGATRRRPVPHDDDNRRDLTARISELKPQVKHTIDLLFSTSSVRSRFEGCGTVSRADAETLGLVGPAGRACGLAYDVRRCFPTEQYDNLTFLRMPKPREMSMPGPGSGRTKSCSPSLIIESLLPEPVATGIVDVPEMAAPAPDLVVTLNEAWRGELSHCILTDAAGGIRRYKIKDPSFHNWNGLSMSLRDTGISDFPLNNKSYNLSYCGFDL
jgi:Ni,Fe-hydrogenase III large subunit